MGRFIRNHAGERRVRQYVCVCVYKAVIVLMDSVVRFRKGVSGDSFFSMMSGDRMLGAVQSSSGVFCRCLHVRPGP